MLKRGNYNTLCKNKEGGGVNIVMIKNSFFLHLIYISLSNDMSGNLNSLDVMIKNSFFWWDLTYRSLSNDILGNLAFVK